MAINVQELASAGLSLAKTLVPSAFEQVTIRLAPTYSRNLSQDTESTSWGVDTQITVLRFDDEEKRPNQLTGNVKSFLVELADLPAGAEVEQDGQIEESNGNLWEIYNIETDPTRSIAVVKTRFQRYGTGVSSGFSDGFSDGFS